MKIVLVSVRLPSMSRAVSSNEHPSGPRKGLGRVVVSGASMEPSLREGDRLLVRWGRAPRLGHIVVVEWLGRPGILLVKRVIRREGAGWWIEGDGESLGNDSRSFGAISPDEILGTVLFRYQRGKRPRT
jgi:nickel-type superoxide dismutase maturation protease